MRKYEELERAVSHPSPVVPQKRSDSAAPLINAHTLVCSEPQRVAEAPRKYINQREFYYPGASCSCCIMNRFYIEVLLMLIFNNATHRNEFFCVQKLSDCQSAVARTLLGTSRHSA